MIRIIIIITLISSFSFLHSDTLAQELYHEIDDLKILQDNTNSYFFADTLKEYRSEFDLLFTNLFVFYKRYISSQDASSCSFTPTCSEYAIQAIKKQGFFYGALNFWDRFTRCNGMSPEDYPVDKNLKLLIDPVRDSWYEAD